MLGLDVVGCRPGILPIVPLSTTPVGILVGMATVVVVVDDDAGAAAVASVAGAAAAGIVVGLADCVTLVPPLADLKSSDRLKERGSQAPNSVFPIRNH